MIIRVESAEKMIEDICDFLDIVPEYLEERIKDISEAASTKEDYSEAFLRLSEEFVAENTSDTLDKIYFCHLARSVDTPEELLPLQKLLTTENSFSLFLKEYGVDFLLANNELLLRYKGKVITKKQMFNPIDLDNRGGHLSYRLGQIKDKDFCINGFLHTIDPEKSTDGYYQQLMYGPEILQDMDSFLEINMCNEYCKRSKYYFAIAMVPLTDVIFDEYSEQYYEDNKTSAYLAFCFKFLLDWYNCPAWSCSLSNEVLRLNDYSSVTIDHYIELGDVI